MDPSTATKLMLVEAAGAASMAGGLGNLLATGASRRLVLPAAALTVTGAALFFTSYLADIYGSATDDTNASSARAFTPMLVTEAGYLYVYDPTFAYRSFFVEAVDLRLGRFRLRPEAWHAFYAFSNAGIPAYISGGGGAIPERMDGIGRHYLNVDVDPQVGILSVGVTRID